LLVTAKYCNLTLRPAMKTIKYEAFEDILKEDDAFFLYLQNFDTDAADLVS